MSGRRKQGRASNGHFLGFWARLNCEQMPVLPAWIVRANLSDPRKIPYLLLWRAERARHGSAYRLCDGEVKEAVRLARFHDSQDASAAEHYVELKRPDGDYTVLRTIWRTMPRNSAQALFLLCPNCTTPRRFVYGWEWDSFSGWSNSVRRISWRCRSCARLRYSSEGGYLRPAHLRKCGQLGVWLRQFGNLPRPGSWYPYVFTSLDAAADFLIASQ